jgi:hypothetical protein
MLDINLKLLNIKKHKGLQLEHIESNWWEVNHQDLIAKLAIAIDPIEEKFISIFRGEKASGSTLTANRLNIYT